MECTPCLTGYLTSRIESPRIQLLTCCFNFHQVSWGRPLRHGRG